MTTHVAIVVWLALGLLFLLTHFVGRISLCVKALARMIEEERKGKP